MPCIRDKLDDFNKRENPEQTKVNNASNRHVRNDHEEDAAEDNEQIKSIACMSNIAFPT